MEANNKAIREALECVSGAYHSTEYDTWIDLVTNDGTRRKLIKVVDEALSKPPRNCDNYDNKTDAEIGFIEETEEDDSNPLYWQLFANWLFAPAVERNGEGK